MAEPIRILNVEREDEDGLIVTFSDGTTAGYVTEELLELRPFVNLAYRNVQTVEEALLALQRM